ncbi:hypothetical protein OR16_18996 [Cupriavidus basilensis OR16]|uniref:DUF3077 domain-containing protein n=1 Tax=Cupriavidus basilensis OR16 TaxID=1127483 RepID=H1S794_9BURK|nr:hypothetical protein [Cupriavidus basilensis]EHP41619.1 hypothetical protein OR16_18996 [Cupriavidus basilensis OR16]
MYKYPQYNITAQRSGRDTFLTAHAPSESPLSLAAEKTAQLNALLSVAVENAAGGTFCNITEETQGHLLSLAAVLAHETLVLSELAALDDEGKGADG